MGEVVKFETREMLHFGKLWRRLWRRLPPEQQERALRHLEKMMAARKDTDSSSASKEQKS
jgi:hypothetical protein